MSCFTNFEKYCLSQRVPSLDLPSLTNDASDAELYRRARLIGYGSLCRLGDEDGLVKILQLLRVLNFSEEYANVT